MSALSLLLNVLWIVFGGLGDGGWLDYRGRSHGDHYHRAALGAGRIQHRTLHAASFGQKAVSRAEYYGSEDLGTGPFGLLGNIVWLVFVVGGWRWGISSPRYFSRSR